ncbi:MAG TPA: DUF362 domain-containing protein [Candidatus Hydrogenedentes bacterium]|nr:DUF362 domain-containing protein [Candidatus Hydrogenedentota bacterium]
MDSQTRRDFMRHTALAGGALALTGVGCSKGDGEAPAAVSSAPEGASVDMSIARRKGAPLDHSEEVNRLAAKLTNEAIDRLGGMGRFVSRGDVVWIKPNIAFVQVPEFATNTNPEVVATLVRLCLEAGAKEVKVGDNSSYGALRAYPTSGIEPAVLAAGGKMVYMQMDGFKDMKLGGERLDLWPMYPEVIESDVIINVPILKNHGLTLISACLKNHMGIAGDPRYLWHTDMPRCLVDAAAFVRAHLSVLDAVRVLTKNGPSGGDLDDVEQMGIVAASADMVALEAFGAELLRLDPHKGRTMANAQERGLGTVDYRSLALSETEVA